MLPKHYFKLTTAGSGDLLTTNRVSRQNVCVGASNVSVFYVYESRCNLSDKGALIDTFGRLSLAGREGHKASNPATARLQTQTSLCLATGYKIYTATPATANIIPARTKLLEGFSHLV